jgi:hypothetical protein
MPMENASHIKAPRHPLVPATLCLLLLMMIHSAHADSLEALQAVLPEQVDQWTAEAGDQTFNGETLFDYIDGGAEVYRAYNLRGCLSRRYTRPGEPAIILDIFDMGSSADAYGVFTHDIDGKKIDIGQDGRLRPGWLSYWKGRFFVSVYMEEESSTAEQAIIKLGRQVADRIPGKGARPGMLSLLPSAGLQPERIRYLHHPVVLNGHYYLSDDNILNIDGDTEAVLADYRLGDQAALLLLVNYPTPEEAQRSQTGFLNHYLPDADDTGAALLENGKWTAVRRKGQLLAIVLDADSREGAAQLLNLVP